MDQKLRIAVAVVVVVLFAVLVFFGYQGFINDANRYENQVKAKYTDNKNVYDNGWKQVKEIAQVPDMYADRVRQVTQDAISGRYGDNGARQIFLAVQESNPQIDPKLYFQIQQAIEIFRGRFQQNQTELVAVKQGYSNYLTATYAGRLFNTFGHYPRINMNEYDIVTSTKTEADFGTKRADELKLR